MRARLALRLGFALGPLFFAVIATTGCVTAGSHGGGTGGSTASGTGGSMTGGGATAGSTGALHGRASARFICQAAVPA